MANAEQIVTNGNGNGVESDEEDLSKMRPVDIDQDVREMERRKRVILTNNVFSFRNKFLIKTVLKAKNLLIRNLSTNRLKPL